MENISNLSVLSVWSSNCPFMIFLKGCERKNQQTDKSTTEAIDVTFEEAYEAGKKIFKPALVSLFSATMSFSRVYNFKATFSDLICSSLFNFLFLNFLFSITD